MLIVVPPKNCYKKILGWNQWLPLPQRQTMSLVVTWTWSSRIWWDILLIEPHSSCSNSGSMFLGQLPLFYHWLSPLIENHMPREQGNSMDTSFSQPFYSCTHRNTLSKWWLVMSKMLDFSYRTRTFTTIWIRALLNSICFNWGFWNPFEVGN